MSAPQSVRSVADTELGLTQGEIQLLRRQQEVMAQRSHQGGTPDRGRGTSRHSQPSSRAASAASSTGPPNRVILDPRHLSALQTHLDNVMRQIGTRINEVCYSCVSPCSRWALTCHRSSKKLRNGPSTRAATDMAAPPTMPRLRLSACTASWPTLTD